MDNNNDRKLDPVMLYMIIIRTLWAPYIQCATSLMLILLIIML